jgi:hypothetical protein
LWSLTVGHARRTIDQKRATQIGLFFILFDNKAILTSPHFPVDMAQVIAGYVLPMLYELDRLAKVGTAMHPRQKAFYDVPSL